MMSHLPLLAFEICTCLCVILGGVWISFNGTLSWTKYDINKFNYHPLFMIIGFIFFMGHGLIAFKVMPFTHRVKKYLHAGLNIIAAFFVLLGTVAIFQFHHEQGYTDFNSPHSWLGLVCLLLLGAQLIGGLVVFQDFFKPGVEFSERRAYKPWHVSLGIGMVIVVIATFATGLQEQYGFMAPLPYSAHQLSYNILTLFVFLWALIIVYILIANSNIRNEGETKGLLEDQAAGTGEGNDKEKEREARRAARRAKREETQ